MVELEATRRNHVCLFVIGWLGLVAGMLWSLVVMSWAWIFLGFLLWAICKGAAFALEYARERRRDVRRTHLTH